MKWLRENEYAYSVLFIIAIMGFFSIFIYFTINCKINDVLKANEAIARKNSAVLQVNLISRKAFDAYSFKSEGKTNEVDVWGRDITWFITSRDGQLSLEVRSSGPDGILFTNDDIIAFTCIDEAMASDGLSRCRSK